MLAEQPSCEYEVFDVRTRRPAEIVHVNAPLEHVWTCDGTNLGLFSENYQYIRSYFIFFKENFYGKKIVKMNEIR